MWDDPRQLNKLTWMLMAFSAVLLLLGGLRAGLHSGLFPLNAVELRAEPVQVSREEIVRVAELVRGNFFTVDLDRTRQAFEQLPWVRKVSVRRKFPWSVEVELEEHVALARWNGNALLNTHGEVFQADCSQALPDFIGQPGSGVQMAQMYGELNDVLRSMQQHVVQLSLSPRFAWQVRLENGMTLELGREQMQSRLARFVMVYPYSLATLPVAVRHVDLRYRNGFAAHLPDGAASKGDSENKV